MDYKIFELPGFHTQSGITFDARVAYQTYGSLNAARDNVIVIPTFLISIFHKQCEQKLTSCFQCHPRVVDKLTIQ